MAKIEPTLNPTIVKNGGPITSDVYKSHATNLWTKGCLLKLASGLLTPCVDTSSGNAEIDTDDTGTSGIRLFIALENHLIAGSVFVAVQEIKANTIFELQVVNSAADTFTVDKGTSYTGYQVDTGTHAGSGLWALDAGDTTKPILNVVDIQANYEPFNPDSTADYRKVYAKVLSAILA